MMCDKRELEHSRERGDQPEKLPRIYAQVDSTTPSRTAPADMVVTMHSCRGNFRSTWIAEAATSRSPT